MNAPAVYSSAHISPCGTYRWSLEREWVCLGPTMMVVMLNPSTADGEQDDPTIRRCMSFARRESYGGLRVVNLFPWRETDPAKLWRRIATESRRTLASVGELNRNAWFAAARDTDGPILCAWGADPHVADLPAQFADLMRRHAPDRPLVCLGTTKSGAPRHPLYVRGDAPLMPWSPACQLNEVPR